jgi:CRISPR-associated protein Csm5
MMRAPESTELLLTPLTPIHIGCGEDFNPTNYVIDKGLLYHFDPSRVVLPETERAELLKAVSMEGEELIPRLQRFFFDRRDAYAGACNTVVSVAPGINRQYEERVGRTAQREATGKRVFNMLEIERCLYHPHAGIPFIPGSSLKGAMRTAWLERLAAAGTARTDWNSAKQMEAALLGGEFYSDPFRLLKVSDSTGKAASKVVFATNHKKDAVATEQLDPRMRRPSVRREALLGGQYRALRMQVQLDSLGGLHVQGKTPQREARIASLQALMQACNRFYMSRMRGELRVIRERRFAADNWLQQMERLLAAIAPALDEGRIMLLRIGRHSGAESVTLEGIRSIKIMHGKGKASHSRTGATTLWLAADDELQRSEMQPFGWLLAEPVGTVETRVLVEWCKQQPKPDAQSIEADVQAKRYALRERNAKLTRMAMEREAQLAAVAAEEKLRAARFVALSEEGKSVAAFRHKLERHSGRKEAVSGALYAELRQLGQKATAGNWTEVDKQELAEVIAVLAVAKIEFGKREKEVKRLVEQLRGKS